jgi:hypothetical protein
MRLPDPSKWKWYEKVDFVCLLAEDVIAVRVLEQSAIVIGQVSLPEEWEPNEGDRMYWFPFMGMIQIDGSNIPFHLVSPGLIGCIEVLAALEWTGDYDFITELEIAG